MSTKTKRMLSIQSLTIVALIAIFVVIGLSEEKLTLVSAKNPAKAFDQQVKMLEQHNLLPVADIASLKKEVVWNGGSFILVPANGTLSVKFLTGGGPLSEKEALWYGFYHPDKMQKGYLVLADGRYMIRTQLGELRIITTEPKTKPPLTLAAM